MIGLGATLTGAIAIAGISTLGDFIWATWIPRHEMVYGLTHGALLFLCIGLFLGAQAQRPLPGAVSGALIGGLAAGSFYVLAPFTGYSVMFVIWIAIWVALGALDATLNRIPRAVPTALARGALAAVASGVAFYGVSGIWFPFNPSGWDYAFHFVAWTLAYLPGFGALLIARPPPADHESRSYPALR